MMTNQNWLEIKEYVEEKIAHYTIPVKQDLSTLQMTVTGKIRKIEMREAMIITTLSKI
jgi:hypothetical protein